MSDYEIEGDWRWFDSSKPIFSKWAIGEPNNYNSNEDFAVIYLKTDNGKTLRNPTFEIKSHDRYMAI